MIGNEENAPVVVPLRDQFAIAVLPTIMAEPSRRNHTARMLACAAYEVADAMLEARRS